MNVMPVVLLERGKSVELGKYIYGHPMTQTTISNTSSMEGAYEVIYPWEPLTVLYKIPAHDSHTMCSSIPGIIKNEGKAELEIKTPEH